MPPPGQPKAGKNLCPSLAESLEGIVILSPRQESNLHLDVRSVLFYPLNYGEVLRECKGFSEALICFIQTCAQ